MHECSQKQIGAGMFQDLQRLDKETISRLTIQQYWSAHHQHHADLVIDHLWILLEEAACDAIPGGALKSCGAPAALPSSQPDQIRRFGFYLSSLAQSPPTSHMHCEKGCHIQMALCCLG